MSELSTCCNIGKVVEEQLHQVGIHTIAQLNEKGSKQAWLEIKAIDPSACYNLLCGLEGAIRGVKWSQLPEDVKKELKEFFQHNQ